MKRILCALLAVVLMAACFAPVVAAEGSGSPSREDIRGHGDIAVPHKDSWLSSYETRYVCASGGVAAFLFKAPEVDMDELYFDDVLEGTELTLLAEENGFYLVKFGKRGLGWIGKGQTAEDTSLLDSVPQLEGSSWLYKLGEGEGNGYAVKFGAKRSASAIPQSGGVHFAWSWVLSGRRVLLDGKYFIWDGEKFVSRDEYLTPQGMVRFTLVPDAEGLYDKLS